MPILLRNGQLFTILTMSSRNLISDCHVATIMLGSHFTLSIQQSQANTRQPLCPQVLSRSINYPADAETDSQLKPIGAAYPRARPNSPQKARRSSEYQPFRAPPAKLASSCSEPQYCETAARLDTRRLHNILLIKTLCQSIVPN